MSNNLSNSNTIIAGIKEVGHKVFGGYAELLRNLIPLVIPSVR